MNNNFENRVLGIFKELCRIPHESGNEKAISDFIVSWARERGFETVQDEFLNVIIRAPGTAGYEDHEAVLLQAHMDMVCEKNADSSHDFASDAIELKVEEDWLMSACGTSLGADNGIGVSAALALLEDDTAAHPPLEIVFTVEEETTFAGAENVDISDLQARRMINLDHAVETEIIAGSCGGTGVNFKMPLKRWEEVPEGSNVFRLILTGLLGGHSGEDIHRGRGNAISLLLRLLEELFQKDIATGVVFIEGGTNRLAIPREASAIILAESTELLAEAVAEAKACYRRELGKGAPELDIIMEALSEEAYVQEAKENPAALPFTYESFEKVADAIRLYPNGIVAMNGSFDFLVESSNNIGIISTERNQLMLVSEVRGAYRSSVDNIVKSIEALAELLGAELELFCGYVPWEYNDQSELKDLAMSVYEEIYGKKMECIALHAGLECGFFAEKRPELDIISIGPDCLDFHSPQERTRVSSVIRFYDFLKEILKRL